MLSNRQGTRSIILESRDRPGFKKARGIGYPIKDGNSATQTLRKKDISRTPPGHPIFSVVCIKKSSLKIIENI
jgi:hypothetical protein